MKHNAQEYLDVLVTLELAARFAEKYYMPVNAAIRHSWSAIRPRVSNTLNRSIFDGLTDQQYPVGALCMLRRQLDEELS